MNELGEVRMQFFLYSDSHDQMVTALQAFNDTNASLGIPGPRHFVTDNPAGDSNFFKRLLPSLADQQKVYDSNTSPRRSKLSPFLNDLYQSAKVQFLSDVTMINREMNVLFDLHKYDVIALDCE